MCGVGSFTERLFTARELGHFIPAGQMIRKMAKCCARENEWLFLGEQEADIKAGRHQHRA